MRVSFCEPSNTFSLVLTEKELVELMTYRHLLGTRPSNDISITHAKCDERKEQFTGFGLYVEPDINDDESPLLPVQFVNIIIEEGEN